MNQDNFLTLTQEAKDAFIKKLAGYADLMAKTKAADGKDTGTFKMIISTENLDRQGDTLSLDNFDMKNYEAHPVVLWGHDYYSLPIGATDKISIEDGKMIAEGKFAPTDEAQAIRKYYEAGFPMAASVGFMPSEFDEKTGQVSKYELLEWSMVAVPANADCVRARSLKIDMAFLTTKGLKFTEIKKEKKDDAKPGDPCQMDDGTNGTFNEEMVCVPNEAKKSANNNTDPAKDQLDDQLREDMKSMHKDHAENVKGIAMKCQKAIEGFYEEKGLEEFKDKAIEEFKAMHKSMDKEHAGHQKKCMKAIEEYMKDIEEFGPAGDEKSLQKLYIDLKSIVDKSTNGYEGISVSHIKGMLDAVVAAVQDKDALQKVETQKSVEEKSLEQLIKLRGILRGEATKISDNLNEVNKSIKDKAKK